MTYRHNHIQELTPEELATQDLGLLRPKDIAEAAKNLILHGKPGEVISVSAGEVNACMIWLLVIMLHIIKVTKCTATLTPSSPFSSCARFATLFSAACALPAQER